MAILPINGHNNTGYTESFITPVDITIGTDLSTIDYSGMGPGLIALEGTEYGKNEQSVVSVNQGLFMVVSEDVTGTTDVFTGTNTLKQDFVVFDGTTYLTVVSVETLPLVNGWPRQKVVFDLPVTDLVVGQCLYAVGKKLNVGSIVTTKDYVVGDRVQELYPRVGTYVD